VEMEQVLQNNEQAKDVGKFVVGQFERDSGKQLDPYGERRLFPQWTIEQFLGDRAADGWAEVEADGKTWLLFLVGEAAYFCRFKDELTRAEVKFSGPLVGVLYTESFHFNDNEQLEGELIAEHPRIPGGSLKMSFAPDRPNERQKQVREQLRTWSGVPMPVRSSTLFAWA
jgi:hypothetical protein